MKSYLFAAMLVGAVAFAWMPANAAAGANAGPAAQGWVSTSTMMHQIKWHKKHRHCKWRHHKRHCWWS
jgi:hypothetical protein